MSDRGVPWQVWVLVTLAAATLSGPLVPHLLDRPAPDRGGAESGEAAAPVEAGLGAGLLPPNAETEPSPPAPATGGKPGGPNLLPLPTFDALTDVRAAPPTIATVRTRPLTAADLVDLSARELRLLRNEIYARHGRRFRDPALQAHFDRQPWYVPRYAPDAFPEDLLTPLEKRNADLIARFERVDG